MYLISRSASLTMPIRDQLTTYHPVTGAVIAVHPALSVQFKHAGDVPPYAREAVSTLPKWGSGLGFDEDPFLRCGALDTETEAEGQGWTQEEKDYVENALRKASANGVEYRIVEAPATPKPWPKYDEVEGDEAAQQIAWQVDQLGLDAGAVRQYESENKNRADVLEALLGLMGQQEEDVIGVISA